MDEQLARQDSPLAASLDRFVCVRIVQAYGLDLTQFQFDNELTLAFFLTNADGTIYARYGSRFSHEGEESISLAGFGATLDSAYELHRGYPANRPALEGKRGPQPPYPTPESTPSLPGAKAKADGSRGKCIHCHQVNEAELYNLRAAGGTAEDRALWRYPNPQVLGMTFDSKTAATLQEIKPDSAAASAGLRTGDRIAFANGQAICSLADFQWVLEHAPAPGSVALTVADKDGKTADRTLKLAADWRRADDFTWRVLAWPMRNRIAGFRTKPATEADRQRLNLPADQTAFQVVELPPGWLKERNPGPQQAGLLKGDTIVGVDGRTDLVREADLLAYLLQQKKPNAAVEYTIRRGKESKTIRTKVK